MIAYKPISRNFKKKNLMREFEKRVGHKLDLKNPQTFNEKIQWLKLNYKNNLMTICADKVKVREYVKEKIGCQFLIESLGIYSKNDKIDFTKLPSRFALKSNWGGGNITNVICKNKKTLNFDETKEKMKYWFSPLCNHYWRSYEWSYKNIRPKVICEKYLGDEDKIQEYKIMCFGGKARAIFVCSDRTSGELKTDWFNLSWEHLPFTRKFPNYDKKIPRPDKLNEMIKIAEKLAEGFPFVRVDLYVIKNTIKFGELTFYPGNGMERFTPIEWDYKIGKWLKLPQRNNFDLIEFKPIEIFPRTWLKNKINKRKIGI